jgi:hypothetical protein
MNFCRIVYCTIAQNRKIYTKYLFSQFLLIFFARSGIPNFCIIIKCLMTWFISIFLFSTQQVVFSSVWKVEMRALFIKSAHWKNPLLKASWSFLCCLLEAGNPHIVFPMVRGLELWQQQIILRSVKRLTMNRTVKHSKSGIEFDDYWCG